MARFEVLKVVDPSHVPPSVLERAVETLRTGGLVAFPTETVYGLGADAENPEACVRIYEVKGRPADNPLIVHFESRSAVESVTGPLAASAARLADALWPGPLTLVVPRPSGRLVGAAAGLDTVAVRVPRHPLALQLLTCVRRPVAAPSANRSGRPSPTRAEDVIRDLMDAERQGTDLGHVVVLDAGTCEVGVESTVVDVSDGPLTILRYGGTAEDTIRALAGSDVEGSADASRRRRSPGTRYRHYAPETPIWLWNESDQDDTVEAGLGRVSGAWLEAERPLVVIAPPARMERLIRVLSAVAPRRGVGRVVGFGGGGRDDQGCATYARNLFHWLREADRLGAIAVLAELPDPAGGGYAEAVRDRLLRASGGRFLTASERGATV